MRSSSMKSFVAVLIVSVVLAAAPRTEARPSQPQRSTPSSAFSFAGATSRVQGAVSSLLQRFFGVSTTEDGLPTDPIPVVKQKIDQPPSKPFAPKKQG